MDNRQAHSLTNEEDIRRRLSTVQRRIHVLTQEMHSLEKRLADLPKKTGPVIRLRGKINNLELLDLSFRTVRVLKKGGILSTQELLRKTVAELQLVRNIGPQALAEIQEALKRKDLYLMER